MKASLRPSPRARHAIRTALKTCLAFLALGALFLPGVARATSVVAPDFDSLVRQADYIVRGTVKSVTSEWREKNGHRFIGSWVEIDVTEVVAGTPPLPLVLEMVGGRVGEDSLTIEGAPSFEIGAEHILFVRDNGKNFYPLVALMHGQYPVRTSEKGGGKFVTRCNGAPLRNEGQVALPMTAEFGPLAAAAQSPTAPALSPDEFCNRIRASRQKGESKK